MVFEFGAAAGVPFKDVFGTQPVFSGTQTSTESSSPPKIVAGPIVDAVLYNRALVEFGAFYRPAEFDSEIVQLGSCANSLCTARNPGTTILISGRGRLWEFPLTVNYYVGVRHARPYFGGGIGLSQELSGTSSIKATDETGMVVNLSGPIGLFHPAWPSFIADAGLEWSRSRVRIRPELRYTRHRSGENPFGAVVRGDQLDLIVGVSFPKR